MEERMAPSPLHLQPLPVAHPEAASFPQRTSWQMYLADLDEIWAQHGTRLHSQRRAYLRWGSAPARLCVFAPQTGAGYPESGSGWRQTGTSVFWALSRNKSNQAMDTACPSRTQAWGQQRWCLATRGYMMQGDPAKLKVYICLCWYNRS